MEHTDEEKAKLVLDHFNDGGAKLDDCVSDKDKQTVNKGVLHRPYSSL